MTEPLKGDPNTSRAMPNSVLYFLPGVCVYVSVRRLPLDPPSTTTKLGQSLRNKKGKRHKLEEKGQGESEMWEGG